MPSRTRATLIPVSADERVSVGRSTKADVMAALGRTAAVQFDSGYEIWVYRRGQGPDAAEYVILFDPAGVVAKTRVRPEPVRADPRG